MLNEPQILTGYPNNNKSSILAQKCSAIHDLIDVPLKQRSHYQANSKRIIRISSTIYFHFLQGLHRKQQQQFTQRQVQVSIENMHNLLNHKVKKFYYSNEKAVCSKYVVFEQKGILVQTGRERRQYRLLSNHLPGRSMIFSLDGCSFH